MYYPLLRGKQFELIALRELAPIISSETFKPIIEPVRENVSSLIRAIIILNENDIQPLIIINPSIGDFQSSSQDLIDRLDENTDIHYTPCVNISSDERNEEILSNYNETGVEYAVHFSGGIDQQLIDQALNANLTIVEFNTSPLIISLLNNVVLIGDFFSKQQRNADYPAESVFSHLHVTTPPSTEIVGFGDYTTLPKEFIEGGGPAYVVTIHASYIDPSRFNEMYVRHYSSVDDGSPSNPAGKFSQALGLLVGDATQNPSIFYHSTGMGEFISLNNSGHFPGLGSVKKLSIKHHVETICDYLDNLNG